MSWAREIFVRNAKLYELVLRGMWQRGQDDALAIGNVLKRRDLGGCRVLDVPCGIGRVGIPLAGMGFEVTGVDYSPHLVRVANSIAGRGASFSVGEMSNLSSKFAEASFDCAINVFTSIGYGAEKDDIGFFRELRSVVRRGGLFLISGLRNRDYIVGHASQNIYEETERVLVLDTYTFDVSTSRERGLWRFYLKEGRNMRPAGEFHTDIRVYSPHEVVSMLKGSGWRVEGVYRSLETEEDFTHQSPAYSIVAEAV